MKKSIFFVINLIGLITFCLVSNLTNAQSQETNTQLVSNSTLIDTYVINLTGNALNSNSAINITVSFTGGTAELEKGFTFKGNGASLLLSDIDTLKNIITAVLTGSINDGKASITGKIKSGSITGNPKLTVTKIEASGGKDLTSDVIATVTTSNSTSPSPTPTPTPSPTPTPTPTPEVQGPSIQLIGPDSVTLKGSRRIGNITLTLQSFNFESLTKCRIVSSNNIVKLRPKTLFLGPGEDEENISVRVSSKVGDEFNLSAICLAEGGRIKTTKTIQVLIESSGPSIPLGRKY